MIAAFADFGSRTCHIGSRRAWWLSDANRSQFDYWSSPAGLEWIEHEHALDEAMSGILRELLTAAGPGHGDAVLDVGCGTGASTLAAASQVENGSVVGVDISRPFLERARSRARTAGAGNASFLLADAQTHDFPAGEFDVLVSRLGMMFFEDPVAAFRNLGRALRSGGRIAFVAGPASMTIPGFMFPATRRCHDWGPRQSPIRRRPARWPFRTPDGLSVSCPKQVCALCVRNGCKSC